MNSCTRYRRNDQDRYCAAVHISSPKKGHKKGHKWPFSVCVNLKKDPNRRVLSFGCNNQLARRINVIISNKRICCDHFSLVSKRIILSLFSMVLSYTLIN